MKIHLLAILSLCLIACQSQPQEKQTEAAAVKMSYHGEKIDVQNALAVSELPDLMADKAMLEDVKLAGDISAACVKKGCWMTTPLADGSEMRVTFKDYGFFIPKDSKGKKAIFEGKAYYDTTSVETLIHYAMDGGMSEEEAKAKYTEPELNLAFEATGVIIQDNE